MCGNMLNIYLPDLQNVIFFPLFRHPSLETSRDLVKSVPTRIISLQSPFPFLASPLSAPQTSSTTGALHERDSVTTRLKTLKRLLFRVLGHRKR
jgi:hypothetical protein